MAATERVVVLMTPEQKERVTERARAEDLSLSDYMRRQALGDDELLAALLAELRRSTAGAIEALDNVLTRLQAAEASRAEAEERAHRRARAEFADIDVDAFARLLESPEEVGGSSERQRQEAP
jgi:hypothetical protein